MNTPDHAESRQFSRYRIVSDPLAPSRQGAASPFQPVAVPVVPSGSGTIPVRGPARVGVSQGLKQGSVVVLRGVYAPGNQPNRHGLGWKRLEEVRRRSVG